LAAPPRNGPATRGGGEGGGIDKKRVTCSEKNGDNSIRAAEAGGGKLKARRGPGRIRR